MDELIQEAMLKHELGIGKNASFSRDAIRLYPCEDDFRSNYFRDIDRIIHSHAYTRYIDKTQVYSGKKNDHISKRALHVQLVSKIGRTIGRALGLNEDLIEAIALGHDIGHVPFGHPGEAILNKISLNYNEGYFLHNVQSVRALMNLEKNGKGLNLTVQVLDGILCHNGELLQEEYHPISKTADDFLREYQNCYKEKGYDRRIYPMTLEGCVVRISDVIGYVGRDIEDAITLGSLKKEDIPKTITDVLGNTNKQIVNTLTLDIIHNSFGKNYIKMSTNVFQALKSLLTFNYDYIYKPSHTKGELEYFETMFQNLFEYYFQAILQNDKTNTIYTNYLNTMEESYLKETTPARKVIDYLAGMTDDYITSEYEKYILGHC